FVLLVLLALGLLLWPLGLWQRYRAGRSRRRARPGWVSFNAFGLLLSSALFLLGAGLGAIWIDGAAVNAGAGLLAGIVLGGAGLGLARFEAGNGQLHYTANAWLVGGL